MHSAQDVESILHFHLRRVDSSSYSRRLELRSQNARGAEQLAISLLECADLQLNHAAHRLRHIGKCVLRLLEMPLVAVSLDGPSLAETSQQMHYDQRASLGRLQSWWTQRTRSTRCYWWI